MHMWEQCYDSVIEVPLSATHDGGSLGPGRIANDSRVPSWSLQNQLAGLPAASKAIQKYTYMHRFINLYTLTHTYIYVHIHIYRA